MAGPIIRITLLLLIGVGSWFAYPRLAPLIAPKLANPQVLGSQTIAPLLSKVNSFLPGVISVPSTNPTESDAQPSDSTNDSQPISSSPSPTNPVLKNIVDEVKQKATDVATEQIEVVKKETSNAFCQALIETIKKQCGSQ